MSPLGKVTLFSDLGIAFAYLAIPVGLLIVWRKRLDDLPYPWMLALFAAFIIACGLTHLVDAIQMPWTTFEHTTAEAGVKAVCAILSISTAAALIAIMPEALRLISPRVRAAELAEQVQMRTRQNMELVREINHRLGNQLQVLASTLRIENRRATQVSERELIGRVQSVVDQLIEGYRLDEALYRRGETVSEALAVTRAASPQSPTAAT
ncbi:MAG: hypothetical protein K2Y29_05030 [Beijerinckiaceae bacterium]|nr:hypothetical protein [Beijerinckiaceae bacterium]